MRAPELTPNLGWLNSDRPLRFSDELKGHVVVLDFWTYCCINCMNILPDLEYLEEKYKDEPFVVIGVHSAKFANEKERQSIRNAMLRYRIHHPVVVDDGMAIWQRFTVRGWPSYVVVGADGRIIGQSSGEGKRELLDKTVAQAIKEAKAAGTLAKSKVKIATEAISSAATGLSFPGKILGVAPSQNDAGANGWLFIADSSHNRVIAASFPDSTGAATVRFIAGTGEPGIEGGGASVAKFHDPQGLAWNAATSTLYVADRNNHSIRSLKVVSGFAGWTAQVETLVGTGKQGRDRKGGGTGNTQPLNAPWDLALTSDGKTLYVAMAGPHQIWTIDVVSGKGEALVGSGVENIVDGPFAGAALAQPSGLALSSDGSRLYFADSEVSAVRYADLKARTVHTIFGKGLFTFGDVDGTGDAVRFQHPLGVAVFPSPAGDRLLVADTYNHKIRLIEALSDTPRAQTFAGQARGVTAAVEALRLDEPGGLSLAGGTLLVADTNHNRIVMLDTNDNSHAWREVMLTGLTSKPMAMAVAVSTEGATPVTIAAKPGAELTLRLSVALASGEHPSAEAPTSMRATLLGDSPKAIAQSTVNVAKLPIELKIPGTGIAAGTKLLIELSFVSCTDSGGLCTPRNATWLVTLTQGTTSSAELK
ncbi:MAG: thioredoxin-like domain-containing protein [Planctomycetota bacterium]